MKRRLVPDGDRGVSPVIAVILMVAVTVILSAVIGTFVLGIGSQVTSTTPQVAADFVYDDGGDSTYGDGNEEVQIIHRGGDPVPKDALTITVAGNSLSCSDSALTCSFGGDDDFEAGDTITYSGTLGTSDSTKVIWKNPEGEGTAIISEDDGPR